jgi:hypothetical protein
MIVLSTLRYGEESYWHKEIPGNEKASQAVKKALKEDISTTERYPPDDLKKWLTKADFKKRDQR